MDRSALDIPLERAEAARIQRRDGVAEQEAHVFGAVPSGGAEACLETRRAILQRVVENGAGLRGGTLEDDGAESDGTRKLQ